jgi:hypothetical protein
MAITKESARSLAVAYHAYIKAVDTQDDNGIAVWGTILLADQRATGIELQDDARVGRIIARARKREADKAA